MRCPVCSTENRDDRTECYHCQSDLTILRTIINRAKQHYNNALEHAERGRTSEAIAELKTALELNSSHAPSHNVLGTLYAKKGLYKEAIAEWERALSLDPTLKKSHEYIQQALKFTQRSNLAKRVAQLTNLTFLLAGLLLISCSIILYFFYLDKLYQKGQHAFNNNDFQSAYTIFHQVANNNISTTMTQGARLAIAKIDAQLQTALTNIEQKRLLKQYEDGIALCLRMEKISLPSVWQQKFKEQKRALLTAILERDLPGALNVYYQKNDFQAAVQSVNQLKSKYPDIGNLPEYITAVAKLQNDYLSKQMQNIEQLQRQKKFQLAIEFAQSIISTNPPEEWKFKLTQLVTTLKKEKTQSEFQQIQSSYQNKRYEIAYTLLTAIDVAGLDPPQQVWLHNELPNIKSGLIKAYWKDMSEQSESIFSQNLTADSAQGIIKKADFIVRAAPDAQFADDALYFKGLAQEQLRQWNNAIASYLQLNKQFPKSSLVPDALYRMGFCYEQLKQSDSALATYQKLIQLYPKGKYTSLANARIKAVQKLSKELKSGRTEKQK
ncbi:MAG: tetratricopeptide repeat protein [bacterium]|nr:tetratricopeptide repeat protein [bacterium]